MTVSAGHYDYIIIGAGSAGCVLANRLSASGQHRVLLLEAGARDHFWTRIPLGYGKLIDHPTANWRYRSEPEAYTGMRQIPIPRGRVLGGSSAINGLVFVRGQRIDYDGWRERGVLGWGYEDVLPVFRKMENFDRGDDALRGRDGPLRVREAVDQSPLYDAIVAAGEQVGLPHNPDYNGSEQEGIARTQTTIYNGRRMSAAVSYLKPAMARPNLEVVTSALAQKLIFEGKRCVGVIYRRNGQQVQANARLETIVSGGSINSPQLLELSGIGQPAVIQKLGIDMVHELHGVGENLRDHASPRLKWQITQKGVTYGDRSFGLKLAWEGLRYIFANQGFLNLPSGPMLAFFRSRPELSSPDCQLHFVPFQIANMQTRSLSREPGITLPFYQLRPESTGSIHIKTNRAEDHPAILFNFLSTELDRRTMVDGIKFTRRLLNASALDAFRGAEVAPGPGVESDDEILDWARLFAETTFHPVGTCKMGQDSNSVVDSRLRVHGIDGLRVADGSIMPTLVSGNTNAACIMIGEKAAEMIIEDAAAR
ncbi:MAG: GMC family oxidoreductase N-terminal domain-containing protein [Burkholderiaceae bacterium]